jgi:hypothetical protein
MVLRFWKAAMLARTVEPNTWIEKQAAKGGVRHQV